MTRDPVGRFLDRTDRVVRVVVAFVKLLIVLALLVVVAGCHRQPPNVITAPSTECPPGSRFLYTDRSYPTPRTLLERAVCEVIR